MTSTTAQSLAPRQRAAASRFGALLSLDVLMALLILIVVNAIALHAVNNAMFKAKATQNMYAIKSHQMVLIEHYAHTGEWLDSDVGLQADAVSGASAGPAAGDAMDRLMSGKGSVSGKGKHKDKDKDEKSALADTLGGITSGISSGVILTLGIYTGFEGVAMLGVRPAVIDAPEQPVVQWLCGRAATPAGWQSPVTAAPTNLPDHLLYSFCRGGAAS